MLADSVLRELALSMLGIQSAIGCFTEFAWKESRCCYRVAQATH